MKPKRRVVPGGRVHRTPTVRRVRPAITPVPRPPVARSIVAVEAREPGAPALDALGGRPVDLGVDLGRGLVLANPLVAASGPYGYGVEIADLVDLARLGAMVTRGTTLRPRSSRGAPRIVEVAAGLLIGTGLPNPGIDAVIERYAPTWARWPLPVIVNLGGESSGDLAEAVRRLEGVPGVAGIELNLSCGSTARAGTAFGLEPDAAASLVGAVRRVTELPLIAKLTAAAPDVRTVARAVEQAGADAISAINTLPGLALAPDRDGPALGSGYGGLCGPVIRAVALRVVWEVAQAVKVPVIGIGGVTDPDDVLDMLAAGAAAVGVGAAALADPMLPVRLADALADACRERGVTSVEQLVGTAVPTRAWPPSTRGAEYAH